MKIFKYPQYKICECAKCGSIFQPEASDNLEYRWRGADFEKTEVFIRCPVCRCHCEVTVIGAKYAEENE